jgi:hypothetical protein
MPLPADRSARRLVARGLLALLLVLVAFPVYLVLTPSWRPMAVRLACALIVAAGCVRARRRVRQAIGAHLPSALDTPPPTSPAPQIDSQFLRVRDDVALSIRSRPYFDRVLWPRLLALAGGSLAPPAGRRWIRRRGPSPGALAKLIAEAESRA